LKKGRRDDVAMNLGSEKLCGQQGAQSDLAGGVKTPFNLSGAWNKERARVDPMAEFNNLDRNWRAQYLKDKVLSPNDGNMMQVMRMPEFQRERYNIFRRMGRTPLNLFEDALIKGAGVKVPLAMGVRRAIGTAGKFFIGLWIIAWNFNDDNLNSWEHRNAATLFASKPYMDPDSKYYDDMKATHDNKAKDDFYDKGFKSSVLYK